MLSSNCLGYNTACYYCGLTWKNGRQLSTTSRPGFTGSYTYDEDGNRLTRTVNGLTTTYYRTGGQLVGQYRSDGKDVGYFLDGNGGVYGIYYDDVTKPGGARTYYFIYNAQGDVIGLYNFNGTLVATYSYDEWGKCTVNALIPDDAGNPTTSGNHVAYFNQFRYRGYMFDDETGFYYLGSRYYDPSTGRFINADGVLGANGDMTAYNLFTYCGNNPVVRMDINGNSWIDVICKFVMTDVQYDMYKFGTPLHGKPNSWVHIPTQSGQADNDIDRYFGPDGRASYDVHWGHEHHHPGVGSPHREDWDWSDENAPHLDAGSAKPYDPSRDGVPTEILREGGTLSTQALQGVVTVALVGLGCLILISTGNPEPLQRALA